MKIEINGDSKEIADLVLVLQNRQNVQNISITQTTPEMNPEEIADRLVSLIQNRQTSRAISFYVAGDLLKSDIPTT